MSEKLTGLREHETFIVQVTYTTKAKFARPHLKVLTPQFCDIRTATAPDSKPCDHFQLGFVKHCVYKAPIAGIAQIDEDITASMSESAPHTAVAQRYRI